MLFFQNASLSMLALAACSGPTVAADQTERDPQMAALAALMKDKVNPAFSKLTFLVFHGSDQDDAEATRVEMQRNAQVLRGSLADLHTWSALTTKTPEARDVFYTYAVDMDRQARQLYDAIARRDGNAAMVQMQSMADTCNNCHHFFRLKIEDSVVPSR
jgi:cytochrome c556